MQRISLLGVAIVAIAIIVSAIYTTRIALDPNIQPPNLEPFTVYPADMYAKSMTPQQIRGLQEGQDVMTEMLRVFNRICRRHDIRYWCMGGTLIGAVRHQGWVPWDGDLDVGMMLEDYPRFLEAIRTELPADMWLQSSDTDPKHYPQGTWNRYLPKLRHLKSCYRNCQDGTIFHNGFQLDIFLQEIQGDKVVALSGAMDKDTSPKPVDWIFPLQDMKYEDITVRVPHRYKEYCISCWGSYPPKLLPRKNRYPHEGDLDPTATCDHHYRLYPQMYKKTKGGASSLLDLR